MPPMDCEFLSANRGAFQTADLTDIEERSPHKAFQIFNYAGTTRFPAHQQTTTPLNKT
jgi:hypothetical protein